MKKLRLGYFFEDYQTIREGGRRVEKLEERRKREKGWSHWEGWKIAGRYSRKGFYQRMGPQEIFLTFMTILAWVLEVHFDFGKMVYEGMGEQQRPPQALPAQEMCLPQKAGGEEAWFSLFFFFTILPSKQQYSVINRPCVELSPFFQGLHDIVINFY